VDDLIAFVTARLDEYEAAAKKTLRSLAWMIDNDVQPSISPSLAEEWITRSAHALREVEADRAILVLLGQDVTDGRERDYDATGMLEQVVRIRAAVWNGHPGYRPEWKP